MIEDLFAGKTLIVFLWFVFALVVAHLVLLRIWIPGPLGLRVIEYIWLGLAALGLIGAAGEVRRVRAPYEIEMAKAHARSALSLLHITTSSQHHCMKFVRTEHSPRNFDDLVRQQAILCSWITRVDEMLPDSITERTRPDSITLPPLRTTLTNTSMLMVVREVQDGAQRIRSDLRQLESAIRSRELSGAETTFIILSPILVVVALALRITKVSVEVQEIRRERIREFRASTTTRDAQVMDNPSPSTYHDEH
jgi:hypothetical protein